MAQNIDKVYHCVVAICRYQDVGAFNRVAKAAGEVGQKTKEKVEAEQPPQPSQSEQKPPEGYSPLH
ncbi:hypothetical protein F2Q68_00006024 [Brassica cretica]|uniref:Uncharacterized protein n=1 Tax=Brassica cretica TaxID=69181 RepID=A0A8S9J6U9_BRACR|nr:hypothetical protein F2Q68_00006024 [Brassica cretica]